MKTVAQYDWTTRAEPKTGEIAGRPGKWDRQAELLLSDVDRNGEPTPIGDIHVGQLMTVTSPVGAADLTVTAVTGLRISVGVVNGYLYPINGQVVSVKWADPPANDNFDPTPLWGALNTEIGERQDGDADLQDQIDNHQHNTDHQHPDYSLTSHNHDTAYAPTAHDHPKYAPTAHDHPHDHDADYAGKTHDHDGVYEPVHDHPYATQDELAQEIEDRKDGDDVLNQKITEEIKRSKEKDTEHTNDIAALGETLSALQSELPVREYTYTDSRSPKEGELAALDALAQPVTAWENTDIITMALDDANGVPLDLAVHFPGEIVRISDRGDMNPDEPDTPDGRLARMESSYLVAEITQVNISGSVNVTPLYFGGAPDVGDDLLLEILPPAGGVDTGELDNRYAPKDHSHSVGAHSHNYEQIAISHGRKTYYGSNINWNNNMYMFPFERRGSSGSLYQGGRIEDMGKIQFKNGTNFYAKIGKSGTLIGTTGESSANHGTFIVMSVWDSTYQSSHSQQGTKIQTIYGSTIWVQDSAKGRNWTDSDSLYWWYRGAGR